LNNARSFSALHDSLLFYEFATGERVNKRGRRLRCPKSQRCHSPNCSTAGGAVQI